MLEPAKFPRPAGAQQLGVADLVDDTRENVAVLLGRLGEIADFGRHARARSSNSSGEGMLRRRIAAAVIAELLGARGEARAECASGKVETTKMLRLREPGRLQSFIENFININPRY